MKKRTSVLTRLGIGAVTVATFGLGIPVLSATPAAASTTTQQLNIVPVSAANNTEDNGCQEYRVTSANLQWGEDDNFVYDGQDRYHGHVVNVILNPSAGINSQFCDAGNSGFGGGLTSDQGVGIPDQFQFQLNSDNDYNQTYFEFGINEKNTPVAGTIGVQAYVDQGSQNAQVDSGEPQASANDTILAGTTGLPNTTNAPSAQQDHLVDTVKATPLSQDASSDKGGDEFTWYKVTASHGTETMQGVDINYQVTSKQGRVVDYSYPSEIAGPANNVNNCINGPDFEDNVEENQNPDNAGSLGLAGDPYFNEGNPGANGQDETDGAGVLYCQVYAPLDQAASGSNPAQSGPYDVNFFATKPCGGAGVGPVDNSGCHEPQAHVTLNTYNTPTDKTGVRPTCGDQSTARNSEKVCFETPNASGETFTARAVDIDTGGTPEPNTVINWDLEYGGQCNKYTAGGGPNDCEFLFNNTINEPDTTTAGAQPNARSNAKASPSFTSADTYTGVLGQVTKYYEAQDGSIGVATMPDQCVTGGSGTCSVTMKLSKTPQDGATFFPIVAFNDIAAGCCDNHTGINGGPTLPITDPAASSDDAPATPFLGGNDCTTTDNDRLGDFQDFYCGAASVEFSREFTPGDTNISANRSNSSARTGKFVTVTSHIMNQFRNHITYPDPTTFHCLGCVFSNGTKQLTEQSSADGRAQVAVTRTHKGKAKVVAEIGGAGPQGGGGMPVAKPDSPFSPGTLCGQHHGESRDGAGHRYYSPSARQGNCSASTTIHFHGPPVKSVERPHLSAGSLHHHHVKLKAKTKPSLSGVKVKFYKKTHSGLKKLVGADRTNSSGVAKSKVKAHHNSKFVAKVVGLKKSLFTSKFSNRVTI